MSSVTITIPPLSAADDENLVLHVTELVNNVYGVAEGDIFKPPYSRTNQDEIRAMILNGQLALAYQEPESNANAEKSKGPIGCIQIKIFAPGRGRFGMLALNETYRGGGLGKKLVEFAEKYCLEKGCTFMHVEALVPTTFQHAFKLRLEAWYMRMGYKLTEIGSFAEDFPHLAPLLRGPTDYKMFEKRLV
ncbi:hypothetical protein B0I35DRAFT_434000 [Stachybotrys elegans]|uniref:N-acetyltransferase domain-containing protein n=1 Tax=Stachybotrys elegans TaxID=80388 RepID=A0A8K0WQ10_9HYPO|nr:hypothetical protein B0I35DRAFT_434000 [Stachybotrys elegans]